MDNLDHVPAFARGPLIVPRKRSTVKATRAWPEDMPNPTMERHLARTALIERADELLGALNDGKHVRSSSREQIVAEITETLALILKLVLA
jgi:hypothetical protein